MKLQIQRRFLTWKVTDETGLTAAVVANQSILSASKKICDPKGNIVYTSRILKPEENARYALYKQGEAIVTAKPVYGQSGGIAFRLPKVLRMEMKTPYGTWSILRLSDESLAVTQNGEPLGKGAGFIPWKSGRLEYTGECDALFWTGIYVLMDYMMREDEMLII